jgi:exosortase A
MRPSVFGAFAAFSAAILLAYRETLLDMVRIWSRSETFNHCFLIIPIVLWLIWQRRVELRNEAATPSAWALVFLGLCGAAWLAGDLARVDAIAQFAVVGMLVALVPLVFGMRISRMLAFPLAFTFLAVPFGEFAMPWMMDRTADFTVGALKLSGIPVYREGLNFVIPSGNWSVIEACSGVRYLIASFTVGSLFAYLSFRTVYKRMAFVGVSIAVPILANWLRAYMIVMIGHLSNNRLAVGVDHLIYGWVFFGVVIMIMFAVGARFADAPVDEKPSDPETRQAGPEARAASIGGRYVLALFPIFLPVAASQAMSTAMPAEVAQLEPRFPVGPWSAEPLPSGGWMPSFERPKQDWKARFVSRGSHVDVYLGYYRQQTRGGKVVGSENVLVRPGDDRWSQLNAGRSRVLLAGAEREVRVARIVNTNRSSVDLGQRILVWHFYWVDGHLTASEIEVKARMVWSMFRGRGDDAAVIVISTPAGQGDAARLQDFLDAGANALMEAVGRAGGAP